MSFCSRWNLKGNEKKAKLKFDLVNQAKFPPRWMQVAELDLSWNHFSSELFRCLGEQLAKRKMAPSARFFLSVLVTVTRRGREGVCFSPNRVWNELN